MGVTFTTPNVLNESLRSDLTETMSGPSDPSRIGSRFLSHAVTDKLVQKIYQRQYDRICEEGLKPGIPRYKGIASTYSVDERWE